MNAGNNPGSNAEKKTIAGHQLYHTRLCPYCSFVRSVIAELNIEIPLKDTMFNRENNAELLAGGGKTQVPCLRIEDENGDVQWMYESGDIIDYLQAEFGA